MITVEIIGHDALVSIVIGHLSLVIWGKGHFTNDH